MLRKQAVDEGIQYTVDSRGSWASLFNPLSPYIEGTIDRIPKALAELAPNNTGAMYALSKAGAMLLLGAAIGGGVAAVSKGLSREETGSDFDKSLERTRYLGFDKGSQPPPQHAQQKTAKEEKGPAGPYDGMEAGMLSGKPAQAVLALGTLIAGTAIGHKAVSKALKYTEKRAVNEEADKLTQDLLRLADLRAANARGQLSEQNRLDWLNTMSSVGSVPESYAQKTAARHPLQKHASEGNAGVKDKEFKWGSALFGIQALALYTAAAASWYIAHKHFGAQSVNNRAYDQYKQELNAYAKERALREPLALQLPIPQERTQAAIPTNQRTARSLPEVSDEAKPMPITL